MFKNALITLFISILLCQVASIYAQANRGMNQLIVEEGLHLYNLEMMAWNSADYIYDNAEMGILRGYLSYKQGNIYKCIYWNGAYDNLEVIHTFSSSFPEAANSLQVDNRARKLTGYEQMLYDIKMQAMLLIRSDRNFFNAPAGTRLNVLFSDDRDKVKAYVITGTNSSNVIPMGNDYLLIFSKNGDLISKKRIHKEYFEIRTDIELEEDGTLQTFHSSKDLSNPYITPTDICNLLLYSDKKSIHRHTVFSPRYVSFFSLNDKSLVLKTPDQK